MSGNLGEDQPPEQKPRRSVVEFVTGEWRQGRPGRIRLLFWIVLAGIGLYLIGTGVIGVITKSQ
jgi:hypothetical protein